MAKQTVTFFSNATEHELVRQCRNDKPVPSGVGWINETPGVRYKFKPAVDESGMLVGRLDVLVGQDKMRDHMGWLRPDEDTSVERDAPTALRAHKAFGHDFWAMPTPMAQVRARARVALANVRVDDLEALLAEEQAEFKRADLIAEIEDSLALAREQIANYEAIKAQEQEEAEQAPKAKAKPKAATPA